MQLLSGKSMIRYFPPKATAGFATFAVRTPSLEPCPPASSIAIISFLTTSSLPDKLRRDIYTNSIPHGNLFVNKHVFL
jgi:hypothetical protein